MERFWISLLSGFPILTLLIKIYLYLTTGRYRIKKSLKGKHVLITGGTSGIGKETVRELARNGATVHILARNVGKALNMVQEFKTLYDAQKLDLYVHELDLSQFQSVRNFATNFLATKNPIHILINNAGLVNNSRKLTIDGNEEMFQANHLSHFLLTNLLLDRIIESGPDARIINVASEMQRYVWKFDLSDLNFEKRPVNGYLTSMAYNYSKLENVIFTRELARRLYGKGATVNCLHPGVVRSELARDPSALYHPFTLTLLLTRIFQKTAPEGAQTTLFLATSDDVANISGQYFADCKISTMNPIALDDKISKDFWAESERLTGFFATQK